MRNLYKDDDGKKKDIKDLTEAEKQNVSALSQLAAGLAAASMGGDVGDMGASIAASKNAVENNYLNSSDHQDKVGLEYKEKEGLLTEDEKQKLVELRIKDESSTNALLEACVDVNSEGCHIERQKAYDALRTYVNYYYNKLEQQNGYLEIKHLLEGTSNTPEANQSQAIYEGYVESYKRFGYDEKEARSMASMTMGSMIMLHGLTGTITLPKINKIFGGSKLLRVGKVTSPQVIKNSEGLNEVKINQTPLEVQNRLNTPDLGSSGKLKPAEAAAAAQLEPVLGKMERYTPPEGATTGSSPDFIITSGPNKGKTVDAMYTTDKLSQKEIDGLNKFYEKNMSIGNGKIVIQDHLKKADFVPVDFRVLTPVNQKIFLDYVKTLPKAQQNKILIMR
ncbi:VENN motif pre-toxin domain-containing protein [Gilliamella sp. WF3-4]|uniref:VENN motif pre-toxin domain-containing protein n=1 Tax=Gilliamella sp. WF3-4 TaxID=3120255 RepID=UPI002FFC14E5